MTRDSRLRHPRNGRCDSSRCLLFFAVVLVVGESRGNSGEQGNDGMIGCCSRVEDIRFAAPVALSELDGSAKDFSSDGPSGVCKMHVSIQDARLSAMYTKKNASVVEAGLLVGLDMIVEGPSPQCDGSFAHLKVRDSSSGGILYLSAFRYWGGLINITGVEDALSAPPDPGGRLKHHTLVLPLEGPYSLEILFHSEGYMGLLDDMEVAKLPPERRKHLDPVRTFIDPWINVSASCFQHAIPSSSPGCECHRPFRHYSLPGYWTNNSTVYVPYFQPRHQSWVSAPPSAVQNLLEMAPGGLIIAGTSRQRAHYYDIIGMLRVGLPTSFPLVNVMMPRTKMYYEKLDISLAMAKPPNGTLLWGRIEGESNKNSYKNQLMKRLDEANLCTLYSSRSFIIFTEGCHIATRVSGPKGLQTGFLLVSELLAMLKSRCTGTQTTFMIASEVASHQFMTITDHTGVANAFRDVRVVAFNEAISRAAEELGVPFIDVHPISLSGGITDGHDPYHYQKNISNHYGGGDEVSKATAAMYLDAIATVLQQEACTIRIVEPVQWGEIQLGAPLDVWSSLPSPFGAKRSISIFVSASIKCPHNMNVTIQVDNLHVVAERDTAGAWFKSVMELGEGKHVVHAAAVGFVGVEVQSTTFTVTPYTRLLSGLGQGGDPAAHEKIKHLVFVVCTSQSLPSQCVAHAGRMMSEAAYDVFLLSEGCAWAQQGFSAIDKWRTREFWGSLTEHALVCLETRDVDSARDWWISILLHEDAQRTVKYETVILLSMAGVVDMFDFDFERFHSLMCEAGAHVAMSSLAQWQGAAGGSLPLHHQYPGRQVTWTDGMLLPQDPSIMAITTSAYECILHRLSVSGYKSMAMFPNTLAVLCAPGGLLSICNVGQSCVEVGGGLIDSSMDEFVSL